MDELIKYMKAMLLIQLRPTADDGETVKPELLLSRAGLSRKEIAGLLDKSEAAVAKTIERARAARARQPITTEDLNA